MLEFDDKTCSPEELNLVATLFEQHTDGLPNVIRYQSVYGQDSFGFYVLYLELTTYEADPKVFFQMLEVDQKIGWTNPEHVEVLVFYQKAIKIIADEEVSTCNRIRFILQKNLIILSIFVK